MTTPRITLRRGLALAAAALALTAAGSMARAAPSPYVSVASFKNLPTPLPLPYDGGDGAQATVAAAKATARATGKLLLIDLGGNWCADCRLLAAVMKLPEVAAFIDAHYVLVTVDVGHINRNLDIPGRYGITKVDGVPSLLVVDRQGRLLDAGHTDALADARHMTPQALADWLARWTN